MVIVMVMVIKRKKKDDENINANDIDDENEEEEENNNYQYKSLRYANPLPGFIDPITQEEVLQPTISPFGHVLGYQTWLRVLDEVEPKNTCPFTKQTIFKKKI